MTDVLRLTSKPPHDFYLSLDVEEYFEAEYDPEEIYEGGYARVLRLPERDILAVATYNGDPVEPAFEVTFPDQDAPSTEERDEVARQFGRILGCDLDTGAFAEAFADDEVLHPLIVKHYGFKRLSRADLYEDAIRKIVHTRISHAPTRRRMLQDLRKTWGSEHTWRGRSYYAYPRPEVMCEAEPEELREFGIAKRKGEYIIGIAQQIVDGDLDIAHLEELEPEEFYEDVRQIRGIGPTSAQSLLLRRHRPDAAFPSRESKGKERGLRRWLMPNYGVDPDTASDEEVEELLDHWSGWEAMVSQYFYYDWIMRELAKKYEEEVADA